MPNSIAALLIESNSRFSMMIIILWVLSVTEIEVVQSNALGAKQSSDYRYEDSRFIVRQCQLWVISGPFYQCYLNGRYRGQSGRYAARLSTGAGRSWGRI